MDRGPEHRESKMTVLCLLIIMILISEIIIYYIIKLLIMENHPSRNRKRNSTEPVAVYALLMSVFVIFAANLY
jgi:hypothetical protein